MRLVDQKGHPQRLELRVVFDPLQQPGKLLLRGDDDGGLLLEKTFQLSRRPGKAHHILEV
jgi:hypothetical protein